MSQSTRRAIAGTMAGAKFAAEGCEEAIRRYDACNTVADVRAVLDWAKARGGWFLRTGEDDRRLVAAFERARARANAAAKSDQP